MTLEEMKRKYAYTLARVGLNVQKGQTVLVEASVAGHAFVPIFAEECYKLGGIVHTHSSYATSWAQATWWSTTWTCPI